MYGISEIDKTLLKLKLENQKKYLDNNFLMINGEYVPYSNFYFSSWHNSSRYIAELNNRVSSLNDYANKQGLKPIFAVLTLPSQYHQKKLITLKSGKTKLVHNKKYINDENHSVKAGSNKLQGVVRSIMNSSYFRSIPSKDRCYIVTKEPHLDGTCHLNLLVFVPKSRLSDCVFAIKSRFLDTHSRVETDINNPTSYVMKYIFKTLDDLRQNPELDNLTDITYWYLKHKIRRFTMSKTFISLDVYRKLNGRIDLISLTKNYNKGLVTVIIDPNTKKPLQIFDEFGELWQKIKVSKNNISPKVPRKLEFKRKEPYIDLGHIPDEFLPFTKMNNFKLINYYLFADKENMNPQRLGNLENVILERDLNSFIKYDKKHNLNDINSLNNSFYERSLKQIPF